MKPILFNTEMTRAILDGRKTQTRRVMKHPKGLADVFGHMNECKQPFMKGDILYVREAWAANPNLWEEAKYIYRADNHPADETEQKWRPSIHMPREAARLFLRVTDVRVERLQDMTDDDVRREGIENPGDFIRLWDSTIKSHRDRYGWNANPWVWAYTFERIGKEDAGC